MAYENINLWFAKDKKNNIITIDEVTEDNKSTYYCPLCNSEVIPKAIKKNAKMTSHFAHIDKSKCSSEGMIHWWFKHKYLLAGDKFIVKSDREQEYICKEVLVEKEYAVGDKTYKPDVTVITECGETVFFEMAYSNKKKIEEYLDMWIELGNIVVEVDLKILINSNITKTTNKFNALFYNGKCFNVKKNDTYYNTIGQYKENVYKDGINEEIKDRLKKLDWFWVDTFRYKKGEIDIEYMADVIDSVEEYEDRRILIDILHKPNCNNVYKDYKEYKSKVILKEINDNIIYKNDELFKIYIEYEGKIPNYRTGEGDRVIFDDCKGSDGYAIHLNRYSKEEILQQINKHINEILDRNERIEVDNYININPLFKNTVKKIENIYKKRDSAYTFYDRFGYIQSVSLYYNGNSVGDFRVPSSIVYSDDENIISEFLIFNIEEYISNLTPINNLNFITNTLDDLKSIYEKTISKTQVLHREKVGKRRYKEYFKTETYNYGIKYSGRSEDIIEIDLFKLDTQKTYFKTGFREYFYLRENILYKGYYYNSDENNEIIKIFKSDADWSELKPILINQINRSIKKDIDNSCCLDCNTTFNLELGEINFYVKNGLAFPRRCKSCRSNKKGGI